MEKRPADTCVYSGMAFLCAKTTNNMCEVKKKIRFTVTPFTVSLPPFVAVIICPLFHGMV